MARQRPTRRTDGRNGNSRWVLPMWAVCYYVEAITVAVLVCYYVEAIPVLICYYVEAIPYRLVIKINILTKFHKDWMQTINILTKFHKDWMKTVTFTVYTNTLLTDAHSHVQRTPDITWSHKLTVSFRDS
ncbi:hypothetical protein DPMN_176445 [Dreissena polymorpha]|uniref:Uncharacterized protein n=1 Tax=Dreissena polymorpha TaxID=45954 RepID=A0A9D4E9X6_DREPO|nr:hypothetical protein DPMN_176445 [Dreissena polymorpha]